MRQSVRNFGMQGDVVGGVQRKKVGLRGDAVYQADDSPREALPDRFLGGRWRC